MNEAFHRPNQIKIAPIDAEKSSDNGSGLKKIHLQAKWRVMKNRIFSKNLDFFAYLFLPIKIETPLKGSQTAPMQNVPGALS